MADGRKPVLELTLYGRFRLTSASGTNLAPNSAKSQALLALLATSEAGGRGRLWLQNKLWPKSDRDRASVSLRQALSEIRRNLGPYREVLVADRRSVSLERDRICIMGRREGQEFLEGIGLSDGDHALDEWLAYERRRHASVAGAPFRSVAQNSSKRPKIYFQTICDGAQLKLIEDIFVDCVVNACARR